MLHPTMPYLTEELFQRLPHRKGEAPESICIAQFPTSMISFKDENVEESITQLQMIVSKFRSQLAALNITKNMNPNIFIKCSCDKTKSILEKETEVFTSIIKSGETKVIGKSDKDPEGCLKSYLNEDLTIYVKVVGLIDIKLEIERVNKRNS
jgi:valyl-tRNA synthetase